jgi:phage protein U
MAGEGDPLQLVDGLGRVMGPYCIARVTEGQATYVGPGIPRRVDFSLELVRYGEGQITGSGSTVGGWFGSLFGLTIA